MIDLQIKKLKFIEEYIRLTDQDIVEKLATLLKEEKQKVMASQA